MKKSRTLHEKSWKTSLHLIETLVNIDKNVQQKLAVKVTVNIC